MVLTHWTLSVAAPKSFRIADIATLTMLMSRFDMNIPTIRIASGTPQPLAAGEDRSPGPAETRPSAMPSGPWELRVTVRVAAAAAPVSVSASVGSNDAATGHESAIGYVCVSY